MIVIEEQDDGIVITNQDTGKRAKYEQGRWVLQYSDGSVSRRVRTIHQAYEWVASKD